MTVVHFGYNIRLVTFDQYSFIEKYFETWFRTSFSCTGYGSFLSFSCQYQTYIFRWICKKWDFMYKLSNNVLFQISCGFLSTLILRIQEQRKTCRDAKNLNVANTEMYAFTCMLKLNMINAT